MLGEAFKGYRKDSAKKDARERDTTRPRMISLCWSLLGELRLRAVPLSSSTYALYIEVSRGLELPRCKPDKQPRRVAGDSNAKSSRFRHHRDTVEFSQFHETYHLR